MWNTRKRIPTALVLIAVVFVCIQYFPRLGFFFAIQVVILASLLEFYYLPQKKNILTNKVMGILLAAGISLSFYFSWLSLGFAVFAWLLLAGIYFVVSINSLEKVMAYPRSIALAFFGAFYVSFTLNHFFLIRENYGPFYVYFLLFIVIVGDSGAFIFGKLFGRHKMTPMASPKKTWEGSLAGILTACLGGIVIQQTLLRETLFWKAILFSLLLHAAAQVSDPLESLFKRAAGVKDSSKSLPGHGGFLDRIDSHILAAPLFYYLLLLIGMD
ncbi:MAG: phosphatidate cytidylyltransferase [Candidatus Aminicenantes bacterium]|nr:phosphatidate cytidylyltransferase [Candidatus Aminicenantes bacterium]